MPPSPPSTPRRLSLATVAVWAGWAGVVLGLAYARLWGFLLDGPSAWRAFPVFDGHFGSFDAVGEAAWRTASGVAGAGLVVVAVLGAGALVTRKLGWRSDVWQERLVVRGSVGVAVLSFTALGLSALGWYSRWPLRVLVVAAAAVTLARAWPARHDMARRLRRRPPWPSSGVQRGLVVVSAAAVLIAFVGALTPEREWDALWYHLGFLPEWLDEGRLVDMPYEYPSLSPMGWELVFGTGMAMGGTVAAKLLHFACLPATAVLVHAATKRHLPGTPAWVATALFVTTPIVLWEATTAYVDLALAFHVAVGGFALWRFAAARDQGWLAVAAVSLGMAAATKHLALPIAGIVLAALAVHLWRRGSAWRSAVAAPIGVGLVCVAMAAPWYVRAWQASGNPVFPEMYEVFGADPARWNDISEGGLDEFKARFGQGRGPGALVTLPWDMTLEAARYGGTLGPLYLALLPALAVPVARRRVRVLAVAVVAVVAVWASPFSSFQMRFLVPAVPALAVLGAVAAGRAARASPAGARRLLGALLVGALAFNLPPFTPLHERDRRGWDGWLTHVVHQIPLPVVVGAEPEADYLARWVPSSRAWRWARGHLGDDAVVLTFSGGDHLLSGDLARIPADSVAAWPATWGTEAGEEARSVEALHQLGVTHVLFDRRTMESTPPDELALHPEGRLTSQWPVAYRDARFVLVRLPWGDGTDVGTDG